MKKLIAISITTFAVICVLVSIIIASTNTSNKDENINSTMTITAYAAGNTERINFEYVRTTGGGNFAVYRETSTDVMYFRCNDVGGGVTVMLDPQTGGPLTYTNWLNNYANK